MFRSSSAWADIPTIGCPGISPLLSMGSDGATTQIEHSDGRIRYSLGWIRHIFCRFLSVPSSPDHFLADRFQPEGKRNFPTKFSRFPVESCRNIEEPVSETFNGIRSQGNFRNAYRSGRFRTAMTDLGTSLQRHRQYRYIHVWLIQEISLVKLLHDFHRSFTLCRIVVERRRIA